VVVVELDVDVVVLVELVVLVDVLEELVVVVVDGGGGPQANIVSQLIAPFNSVIKL
jgi:phosphoglycerate-specific signal transduction histidine kinase